MSIEVKDLQALRRLHRAGRRLAQDPRGELVAPARPSGSGKTTLLRIIAGLDFPTGGQILMDGSTPARRHVGAQRRLRVPALRPVPAHDRVRERRVRAAGQAAPAAAGAEPSPRAGDAPLELVQLEGIAQRYPRSSRAGSGSAWRWRGRWRSSRGCLLDEPFGALDAKVRKELRRWLRRLHEEMGLTSVFVTHDQEEALELADRVVVMSHGRIEQVGTPGGGLRPAGDTRSSTSSWAT